MLPHETKVLLIDDSKHVRLLVRMALKKLGFSTILEASDGEEGWQIFQMESPHLIFLDQIMPRLSGTELLSRVRANDTDTRVVIMSSLTNPEKIIRAKELGADHYLLKPFTRDKIVEVLSQLGWQFAKESISC